jgi:hypothetical protein
MNRDRPLPGDHLINLLVIITLALALFLGRTPAQIS